MPVDTQFLAALNKIRGSALGCNYKIPPRRPAATIDFTKVNVQFTTGGKKTSSRRWRARGVPGDGNAWYYDNPATPTQIILCTADLRRHQRGGRGRRPDRLRDGHAIRARGHGLASRGVVAIQKRRHPCPVFPIRWKRLSKGRPQGSWRTSLRRAALCLCVSIGTLPLLWGAIEATDSRAVAAIGFAGTAVRIARGRLVRVRDVLSGRVGQTAARDLRRAGRRGATSSCTEAWHCSACSLRSSPRPEVAAGSSGGSVACCFPASCRGATGHAASNQSRSTSRRGPGSRRNGGRTPAPSTRRWARSPGSRWTPGARRASGISSRPRTATASTRFATRRCAWGSPPPSTASIGALPPSRRSAAPAPCRGRESLLSRGSRSIRSSTACCTKASPLACSRAWPGRPRIPQIRETLTELAADEGRHAAHAWHVVQWCAREGGAPVAHALLGATRALAEHPQLGVTEGSVRRRLGAVGHPGAKTSREEEYAAAKANVVRRVDALAGGFMQTEVRAA